MSVLWLSVTTTFNEGFPLAVQFFAQSNDISCPCATSSCVCVRVCVTGRTRILSASSTSATNGATVAMWTGVIRAAPFGTRPPAARSPGTDASATTTTAPPDTDMARRVARRPVPSVVRPVPVRRPQGGGDRPDHASTRAAGDPHGTGGLPGVPRPLPPPPM